MTDKQVAEVPFNAMTATREEVDAKMAEIRQALQEADYDYQIKASIERIAAQYGDRK